MDSSSELPPFEDLSTPTQSTTASTSSLLRFPAPDGDKRVSYWVESISATNMSNRSDDTAEERGLSESTYEFIDTDGESHDDNATESIASTDFGRPDDVASLADTDDSGEDSGDDEDQTPSLPAVHSHNATVEEAFSNPTISRSSSTLLGNFDKPLSHSIEFEEPYNVAAEIVSVKHTIADFDEEKTAEVLKVCKWQNLPKRLVVTICQTMTKEGLSTREPLRILYVGSHSAKQDIIHKIASSVTASVNSSKRSQRLRHSASQLYNVVPVSEFGSERTPEIELMHSSGYQIKVEDCTSAQALKFERKPEKPDVFKLILDDNFAYHSVPEQMGFAVEPAWDLPHIAIFYCSENDDTEVRKTRTVARRFMSRHDVPSIIISHKQLFNRGQCMTLDPHTIHMCLESRDANGRGNIVHQRLPIDLASFLNIDARQMNRNLAYVTGLHESVEKVTGVSVVEPRKVHEQATQTSGKAIVALRKSWKYTVGTIRHVLERRPVWQTAMSVGMLFLSLYATAFADFPNFRLSRKPSEASISVNSKAMSFIPVMSTVSTTSSSIPTMITSSPVAVSYSTSTRTITVTQSLSPGPNSLSTVPSTEVTKLTQGAQNAIKGTNKPAVCSAERLGERKILLRIPSNTKFNWFTKDSMFVNITRNNITVETERLSSTEDGIVLLLPKKEAYGILNISVVTKKRPRVNETFQVDFGTSSFQSWNNIVQKIMKTLVPEGGKLVDPHTFSQMREKAEYLAAEIMTHSQTTFTHLDEVRRAAMEQATAASTSLADLAKSLSLEAAKKSDLLSKEVTLIFAKIEKSFETDLKCIPKIREPIDNRILRAQVQSKLLWLKLQGKEEERLEYEKRASEAIRKKSEQQATPKKAKCATRLEIQNEARLAKEKAQRTNKAAARLLKKEKKANTPFFHL